MWITLSPAVESLVSVSSIPITKSSTTLRMTAQRSCAPSP